MYVCICRRLLDKSGIEPNAEAFGKMPADIRIFVLIINFSLMAGSSQAVSLKAVSLTA